MQHSVLTDTEAETSMDLDTSAVQFNKQTMNATKSVFNISLEDLVQEPEECMHADKYENQLKQEIKDWDILWRKTLQKLKESKEKHTTVDCSLLNAEKRCYLEMAPDLQMFLRNSIEFRQKAHLFLEKDATAIFELQDNLIEVSDYLVGVAKENKIKENIADVTNLNNHNSN